MSNIEHIKILQTGSENWNKWREKIVYAVASPPEEWGLTMNERETLVDYLTRHKQELLANNIDEI